MGKKTTLYDYHSSHAYMGKYAGFEMPLWFEGIAPEVKAVRNGAGVFDISHMGRVLFKGRDSGEYLDILTTNEISSLEPFQARYGLMCDERGGILDDLIVTRLSEEYMVVWNAVNSEKNLRWSEVYKWEWDVKIEPISDLSFMLAVQGPSSQRLLQSICDRDLGMVRRFRGVNCRIAGTDCLVTRTGYTGEDGFEIVSRDLDRAKEVWTGLLSKGVVPAGLGARDVLRLEAGFPLYGNDMGEDYNPFEARLEFAVKLEKQDFIGKRALLERVKEGVRRWRIGLRMVDRSIPREGYNFSARGNEIGSVTSGTFSPTLGTGIAMGYANLELPCGTDISVDIRGREGKGLVSDMPFYDQARYGWKRKQLT